MVKKDNVATSMSMNQSISYLHGRSTRSSLGGTMSQGKLIAGCASPLRGTYVAIGSEYREDLACYVVPPHDVGEKTRKEGPEGCSQPCQP